MGVAEDADPAAQPSTWRVVIGTALVYAAVGWLALLLAVPPGYASPLYPSAGLALAATLVFGQRALWGVAAGAFVVNVVLSASRGQIDLTALAVPAFIGFGAALQAGVGAALVRRYVPMPLVLAAPRDILLCGALGAFVACLVNATLATAALWAIGTVAAEQTGVTWVTWWVGDTLGVLIGAPLALTAFGRPRDAWVPRRRSVGLPLLLASALLGVATLRVSQWEAERLEGTFEQDARELRARAELRLRSPLHALQSLHGAYLASGGLDARQLDLAARWWLQQPIELQAAGHSLRVPRAELPAFEAAAAAEQGRAYRVFDRSQIAAADAEVVAIRWITPLQGNAAALGVNALSIPAARQAVETARDSGEATATAGFRLTQSAADETGLVIYQALYGGATPATPAERAAAFSGVLFVTLRAERLLANLPLPEQRYVHWCLVDTDRTAPRRRLAGAPGCENAPPFELQLSLPLNFATRAFELRAGSYLRETPGRASANAWMFAVAGMLSAAMLGALLLTVTGRARRIEQAVEDRTADLQREVAERTRAEQALRDGEARLRSILDNVPIGVMFLDLQGRIVETNPHLCTMLGRPAALLRQCTLWEISHAEEDAETRRQLAELRAGEVGSSRRQMRLLTGDGKVLWVRALLTVLRDECGRPLRIAGVAEDITEHLRLEESERALDRAEAANRAKSDFVSRMSHELRTPLNAMIGFAQLLSMDREPGLSQRQREWTGQIQRAGWHLLEMINDTLDLARVESGAVQLAVGPLHVPALVSASMALVASAAAQRGVVLHEELSPDARGVLGDETRVKQVLINLLTNAIKYNRDGGSVVVGTLLDAEGRVEIAVRDTGLGMSPEQMASLFQPYNRLGRESGPIEGTGIGLVISRRLAELMGGTLEAASVAGQGSVFTLRLPRADVDARGLPAGAPDAGPAPYRSRLVHYIEDNETNIEVMRGIMAQRPQVQMEVSTMGLDGLTALRRRRPDLILLDMQLPDISGLELLRHLKQDDDLAHIPVLVVSADATSARIEEALTLGAVKYITKPVDIPSFLQVLDEVLQDMDSRWVSL